MTDVNGHEITNGALVGVADGATDLVVGFTDDGLVVHQSLNDGGEWETRPEYLVVL